jgi:long-chain acyl-CoA synthetase
MPDIGTLVDLFETSCRTRGTAPLFGTKVDGEYRWITYQAVHQRVAELRLLLKELGIAPGDRVALIADKSVDWAAVCYATVSCGAVSVPMYTAQSPADWEYILRDCGAKIAFLDATKVAEPFEEIRQHLPELLHAIAIDGGDQCNGSLKARLAALGGRTAGLVRPLASDPAAIIYTSGTTGQPKGVILSHRNIVSNVLSSASTFPLLPSDRSLSFLPWAHALGQTVDLHLLLHVGCQIGINGDLSGLLTNLGLVRPTILVAVPRVFYRIYEGVRKQISERPKAMRTLFANGVSAATRRSRGLNLRLADRLWLSAAERLIFRRVRQRFGGELRFAICGSAALNREVAEFVNALGIEVYEGYGLTEASPVVCVNTPSCRRFGTVGKPIPGVRVSIDRSVTHDPNVGEILVSGPNVMQGYYGAPEDTARVLASDGQLRTGDMGRLDDDGYLIMTGRIKEQYKLQNGKYVVPTPIEEQIRLSPLISNCLLYGADKPYCVVLVVYNQLALQAEAKARGFECIDAQEDPRILAMLKQEVAALTKDFHSYMRPRKLMLLSEDFTVANGCLTPSLKVRRQEVIAKYHSRIEQVYGEFPVE